MSFADLLTRPIFIFLSILNNSCIRSTPFKKIEFAIYTHDRHTCLEIASVCSFEETAARHFMGLNVDIVEQKCEMWETRRFDNRTPMRLKMTAIVPWVLHQKLFVIFWMYIELGIYWQKHRIKQIEDEFLIHKSRKIRTAMLTQQSVLQSTITAAYVEPALPIIE